MGITSDTWWEICCDGCGDTFPDNDAGGNWLAQSEQEAREMVTDYDGEMRNGKVICPTCIGEGREGAVTGDPPMNNEVELTLEQRATLWRLGVLGAQDRPVRPHHVAMKSSLLVPGTVGAARSALERLRGLGFVTRLRGRPAFYLLKRGSL